jgi:hypothetical protein
MRDGISVFRYYLTALRFTEVPRIPLTWSLAPGGWDGLSCHYGTRVCSTEGVVESSMQLIGREKKRNDVGD